MLPPFCIEKFRVSSLCLMPKDSFATATRMSKPKCLVHSCVDHVFPYPYMSCPEIKGHAIETGRMTCKIILYTESMGGLFVLDIILFLL